MKEHDVEGHAQGATFGVAIGSLVAVGAAIGGPGGAIAVGVVAAFGAREAGIPKPLTALTAAFITAGAIGASYLAHQKPAEPMAGAAETTIVVEGNDCRGIQPYTSPDGKMVKFILPAGCKFKSTM